MAHLLVIGILRNTFEILVGLDKVCPPRARLGVIDSSVLHFEAEVSIESQEQAV